MSELSQAEMFPLIRSGGLFIVVAGASIVLGSFFFRARYAIFGLGAAAGGTLTGMFATRLAAPYGVPDAVEIASLAVAVVLEMVMLAVVLRANRAQDDRHTMLAILTIVGGHFVLMAPAFGPLVALLAGASVLNTLVALLARAYAGPVVWAVDGALKAVVGTAMFYGHQLPCTMCVRWSAG